MFKFKHAYWGEEWQDPEKFFPEYQGRFATSAILARFVGELFYNENGDFDPTDFETYVEVLYPDGRAKKFQVQSNLSVYFTAHEHEVEDGKN